MSGILQRHHQEVFPQRDKFLHDGFTHACLPLIRLVVGDSACLPSSGHTQAVPSQREERREYSTPAHALTGQKRKYASKEELPPNRSKELSRCHSSLFDDSHLVNSKPNPHPSTPLCVRLMHQPESSGKKTQKVIFFLCLPLCGACLKTRH